MNALNVTRTLMRHGVRIWITNPSSSQSLLARHCVRLKHDSGSSFIFDKQPLRSSDNTTNLSDPFPSEPIMELDMPSASAAVEAISEPTLTSLGLCSYSPVGLIQRGMELLHVTADLPWWGVIATSAVIVRICLLPIVVRNRKATVTYVNTMADMQTVSKEINEAKMKGDTERLFRLAKEREVAMKNVPFKDMFFYPLVVQGGVLISVLWGLRGMATLPVDSLKTGGMAWFPDLTIADPFFALPAISALTYLTVIESNSGQDSGQEMGKRIKLVLRLITPVIFVFTLQFPSAMTLYFSVNGVITLGQAFMFRNQRVKDVFGIGEMKKMQQPAQMPSKQTFQEGMREAMETAKILEEMNERERLRELAEKRSKEKKS